MGILLLIQNPVVLNRTTKRSRHKNTSNKINILYIINNVHTVNKRKRSKKKNDCCGRDGGAAYGRQGGKGEPKSGPFGALKRKSPPPFPPCSGYGNDGKPYGFTTFPQPPHTPFFPSDFLPFREKKIVFLLAKRP
jgi:hypothetical protein